MLLAELNKIMPILKNYGFYVKWNGKPDYKTEFYNYKDFSDKYDFTKIQVIECKRHFCHTAEFDFELVLKQL